MYTLIPTVYRALLKSAVSGLGHRIHTTKKTTFMFIKRAMIGQCRYFLTGQQPIAVQICVTYHAEKYDDVIIMSSLRHHYVTIT